MKRNLLALLGVLLVITTSCGSAAEQLTENAVENQLGDDANVDIDTDTGEVRIESDDGSAVFGGGEIPDGLEIPVPDGGDVVSAFEGSNDGESQFAVSIDYRDGDYEEIVAFYDDQIGTGDNIFRSQVTGDGSTTSWSFQDHPRFGTGLVSVSDEPNGPFLLINTGG
jgi:hypothetical protein